MPYGLIVFIASFALTAVFVLITHSSNWLKAMAVAVLLVSIASKYGLFLQAALGVSLSLYFTYSEARAQK